MALTVTTVPRNLATKVRFLYLEFEDLFFILSLAVVMNVVGRFFQRDIFGMPMNIFLQWIVPALSVPSWETTVETRHDRAAGVPGFAAMRGLKLVSRLR